MDISRAYGNTNYSPRDFLNEVAKGNIPGHSLIGFQMQGEISTTVADVWGGVGSMIYPTGPEVWEVVSDDASDTVGGIGGSDGVILSLDGNGIEQGTPFILDGITPVTVGGTHLRPQQIILLNGGSNRENVGTIELRVQGGGNVRNVIMPNKGLSMDGHYTVPYDSTGFLIQNFSLVGKDVSSVGFTQLRDGINPNSIWLTSGDVPVYQNMINFEILAQFPVAAGTDLRLRASTVTGTGNITIIDEFLIVQEGF